MSGSGVARLFRTLGVAALAGLAAGVIAGGAGGRIVMKLVALVAGPAMVGVTTANGNRVGDLTLDGTLEIVLFSGVFTGLLGGACYLALRPWLVRLGRWRGVAFGIVLLAIFGHFVVEPQNFDFRRFGLAPLNVAFFAALFIVFGVLLAAFYERLDRLVPTAGPYRGGRRGLVVLVWLASIPMILFLVLGFGATIATIVGVNREGSLGLSLSIFGTLIFAGIAYRLRATPAAAYALLAVPVLGGAFVTLGGIVAVLR